MIKAAGVVQRLAGYRPAPRFAELWRTRVDTLHLPDEMRAALLDESLIDDLLDDLPGAPAAAHLHAFTHTTFSPNLVDGGAMKTSVIPDHVVVNVDIRDASRRRSRRSGCLPSCRSRRPGRPRRGREHHERRLLDLARRHFAVGCARPGRQHPVPVRPTDPAAGRRVHRRPHLSRDGRRRHGAGLFSPGLDAAEFGSRFHGHDERIDVESLSRTTSLWHQVCRDMLT